MVVDPTAEPAELRIALAIRARIPKRRIINQLAVTIDKVRNFFSLAQSPRVVIDIVKGCESQYHDVRRIVPDLLTQSHQLLSGAIAGNAKVDHLDPLSGRDVALLKSSFQERPEGLLHWHVHRF